MKPDSLFHNSDLTALMTRFSAVAEKRFTMLDKFNKDCKTLTKLMVKYAVPEIDWVWIEHDHDVPEEQYCALGWHDETIVFMYMKDVEKLGVSSGYPIYEAPAIVRSYLAEYNLLPVLMMDACGELEELSHKL